MGLKAQFLEPENIHVFLDTQMQNFLVGQKEKALQALRLRCKTDAIDGVYACRTFLWLRCVYASQAICQKSADVVLSRLSLVDQYNFIQTFAALRGRKLPKVVLSVLTNTKLLPYLATLTHPLRGFIDLSYTQKKHQKKPDKSKLLYFYFEAKEKYKQGQKKQAAQHLILFLTQLKERAQVVHKKFLFGNILRFIHQKKRWHSLLLREEKKAYQALLKYEGLPL